MVQLLSALGTETTPFFYLRLADKRGDRREKRALIDASREDVELALRYLNVPPAQYLVVDGQAEGIPSCSKGYVTQWTHEMGLAGQLGSRKQCHTLIATYETAHGMKFDKVNH